MFFKFIFGGVNSAADSAGSEAPQNALSGSPTGCGLLDPETSIKPLSALGNPDGVLASNLGGWYSVAASVRRQPNY